MSEHHFRPTSNRARAATSTLLALVLGCACQSSGSPTESTATSTAVTTVVSTVTSPAAPQSSATGEAVAAPSPSDTAQFAKEKETVEATKPTQATKPATDVKPAADTKPKAEEPAKAEPAAAPEPPKEPEAPAIEKPCLAKSFKFAAVRSACEKGGVPKAKSLMKAWTNKAKEKGESYKCATCHDNQKTYTNKPSADADLRKLLDIIK